MEKAVLVLSGGIDSVCTGAYLKSKYTLYGISFSYGQRASKEIKTARTFSKVLGLKDHKVVDISFMKDLYGKTNVLTDSKKKIPKKFDYSIVVPIRNTIFLSIASAWAYTLNASLVAYGAHNGDKNYPDCRPIFTKSLEKTLNLGEIDGINLGIRKRIKIWSPFRAKLSKGNLITNGHQILGDKIFNTWSCYNSSKSHCGKCESCNNRRLAFHDANISDKTRYLS